MAELTRESSFERVLSSMSRSYTTNYESLAAQHEASRNISTWLKRNIKLKAIYKSMHTELLTHIARGLDALSALDGQSFEKGQEILSGEVFVRAFSSFLNLLPSDPTLKKKNKMARSVRVVSSALLITKFPGMVLEEDGQPDSGEEAKECHMAALVFMMALKRFVSLLQRPSISLNTFRNGLLGYRFSLRNFLGAIDAWKQVDKARIKHSFESAYCESYMLIWTSQKVLDKISEQLEVCSEDERPALLKDRVERTEFVQWGTARLGQLREMLCKLLGTREGRDLLEELDAYLLSNTQFMEVRVTPSGEEGSLTPSVEGSGVHVDRDVLSASRAAAGRPSGSSVTSSASTSAPSPEATKLTRVSRMTGLDENRLLHELCLDPKYQLPDPLPPLLPFDSATDGYSPEAYSSSGASVMDMMQSDPVRGQKALKIMMIRTIEDRFVANMLKSKMHSASEMVVGGVYPVLYGADVPGREGKASGGVFMHAQVLSIDKDRGCFDCQYVVDGIVDKALPLSRVRLASQQRDAVQSGFVSFLQEVVGRIAALIPSRSDMHAQLKTAIDLALLQQMVANDAMSVQDLLALLSTLVGFITQLQSPHRSSEFEAWFAPFSAHCLSQTTLDGALIYVPKFFEIANQRLEQVQLEVANFYLSGLASYAQAEGAVLLRDTVKSKIKELIVAESPSVARPVDVTMYYAKYLPRVTTFLCSQLQEPLPHIVDFLKDMQALKSDVDVTELAALGVGGPSVGSKVDLALVARAFSLLLQQNVDLATNAGLQFLPETFLWDGSRLRDLKNEIDSLVLVTTLLISCRSYLLSMKKRLSEAQEAALQDLLYEVMRDASLSLTEVVTTAQNFVRHNFSVSGKDLPEGWEKTLEDALIKCVSQTSPVFLLFSKRVHAVLVKAVLDVPFTDTLARHSMNSRPQIQQLKRLISLARGLFSHNTRTFGDIYSSIFRSYVVK